MEGIISAIIGGFFSLVAIWFQHYLSERKNSRYRHSVEKTIEQKEETTATKYATKVKTNSINFKKIFLGVMVLCIGLIIYVAPIFVIGLDFGGSSYLMNFIGGGVMVFGLYLLVTAFKRSNKNT